MEVLPRGDTGLLSNGRRLLEGSVSFPTSQAPQSHTLKYDKAQHYRAGHFGMLPMEVALSEAVKPWNLRKLFSLPGCGPLTYQCLRVTNQATKDK